MSTSVLPPLPLPAGITEHYIDTTATTGLTFHILSAGHDFSRTPTSPPTHPLVLLLHGYPELAFSWRHIMLPLASAAGPQHPQGFHVVAVDQRGYGRTTGWEASAQPYEITDFSKFSMTNLVRDMVALVSALGYEQVHCLVGHDFGAVSAAHCALMRPDMFTRLVTMSHPFKGPPGMPFASAYGSAREGQEVKGREGHGDMDEDLKHIKPPRKHYKTYNSTKAAAEDWVSPEQGLKEFLRGYFFLKSGDYEPNHKAHALTTWAAEELAKMPGYYVMPYELTMPQTVAKDMQGYDASPMRAWLDDGALDVYVQEWSHTGFQGGLNWYRATTEAHNMADVMLFSGKKVECPSVFVSGSVDWGIYQQPGAMEGLGNVGTDFRGVKMIDGVGHWAQQEKPHEVIKHILDFVGST